MSTTCVVCNTPTNTRCARCKSVYYCSKAHIAQDWPVHKVFCKRISEAGTNPFDAILFGVNERLIKLPWTWGPLEEGVGRSWQNLDDGPWFKGRDSFIRTLYVQKFGANGPSLGRTLAILYDDNFLVNGSSINRCIQSVVRGDSVHPWAGNILALRAQGMPSDWYNNAVMEEDLAPLIRYFEDYGK
ncbi:uncharacterized protein EV420DRAFT_1258514 [Desarmillaria tabescens]|uniref:MYND-type domain-containing protein n=1 Tax=Armillaria tabescens TaxID=1929756 RepID=A0AA39NQX0_ARMTA|nr:uncharacterized protein EV420DRAFT_1258514 [Desarmillaria tabescens]KAK0470212.1 hypothetical protein EV420DRAFT_1258514 [Desarmillaria tabescens]